MQYFKSNLLSVFRIILGYKPKIIRSQQLLADPDLLGYQEYGSVVKTC